MLWRERNPEPSLLVKGEPRTHHVHIVDVQSDVWKMTLTFRDLVLFFRVDYFRKANFLRSRIRSKDERF